MMKRPLLSALLLSTALFVAGCESAEEKAEGYYQSALALMAEGDEDRALIELRNVFEFNGFHKEARLLYANTLRDRGEIQQAYSQYLLLVEQYPDTVEVRITLAELAANVPDFDEVERHGNAAIELAPEDPRVRAIGSLIDFRRAAVNADPAARAEALAEARAVLEESPDNLTARRVVISEALDFGDEIDALPLIEEMLELNPEFRAYHGLKYDILRRAGRIEEAGAQIAEMYRLFPEDEAVRNNLVAWTYEYGSPEETEALLRNLAGGPTETPGAHVGLVEFLARTQGTEAALAELDGLIAANAGGENETLYRGIRANTLFQSGARTEAITEMRAVLETAEDSAQARRFKIVLADMLVRTQDVVGARALIEEVLAADATNVDALMIRAQWKTEEDDPEGAIADLRTALGQDPRNAQVLLLMAVAHERAGQTDLSGQRLALAYEAANAAPYTALPYANFLVREGELVTALEVLDRSNTDHPGDLDVMAQLGQVYLDLENWAAIDDLRTTLIGMDTEASRILATQIEAAVLMRRDRIDDALEVLQTDLTSSENPTAAQALVIVTQMRANRFDEARAYLDGVLAESPEDPALRLLDGALLSVAGEFEAAEVAIRAVHDELPQAEAPAMMLFRLLAGQGFLQEAEAVLDTTLAANPGAIEVSITKAGVLEREGDFEGAIAIYEALYAQNSADIRIANNLASMLSSYSDDPADLERARNIGRRLGDIQIPAVQDTFGWIAYQQGNYAEALAALEPAAAGLPGEPLVQYHLGMTYAALERTDQAIEKLTLALELAEGRSLPQMETARATLEELQGGQ